MTATNDMAARLAEKAKYDACYQHHSYAMGQARMRDAYNDLAASIPEGKRSSFLDVSTGRGEMLRHASALGYGHVRGTEIVDELIKPPIVCKAYAHDLPFEDASFQVVSMNDVIEHLLPGDDEAACRELRRVASEVVLLTANNRPSRGFDGSDLHINIRPYEEWDALFRSWFDGCSVEWLKAREYVSHGWRIRL